MQRWAIGPRLWAAGGLGGGISWAVGGYLYTRVYMVYTTIQALIYSAIYTGVYIPICTAIYTAVYTTISTTIYTAVYTTILYDNTIYINIYIIIYNIDIYNINNIYKYIYYNI